ncbi:hypothetical protein [Candidatus Palauibacter sp.]
MRGSDDLSLPPMRAGGLPGLPVRWLRGLNDPGRLALAGRFDSARVPS